MGKWSVLLLKSSQLLLIHVCVVSSGYSAQDNNYWRTWFGVRPRSGGCINWKVKVAIDSHTLNKGDNFVTFMPCNRSTIPGHGIEQWRRGGCFSENREDNRNASSETDSESAQEWGTPSKLMNQCIDKGNNHCASLKVSGGLSGMGISRERVGRRVGQKECRS